MSDVPYLLYVDSKGYVADEAYGYLPTLSSGSPLAFVGDQFCGDLYEVNGTEHVQYNFIMDLMEENPSDPSLICLIRGFPLPLVV